MSIFDVWVNDKSDNAKLSELWVGEVRFHLLELPPPSGHMWSCGRPTKIEKDTPRPDYMWVEDWRKISKNKKLAAEIVDEWKNVLKPRVLQARQTRNIKGHVDPEDVDATN